MTKQEIIDYMYKNHVQGDFKIEEMAEDFSQPDLQPTCNQLATDTVSRQDAKDAIDMALDHIDHVPPWVYDKLLNALNEVPSAEKAQLSEEDATKDATSDLIRRVDAVDIGRRATVDTNPDHFDSHQKFEQFMNDVEISSFGRWEWANGFNTALTAISIDLKQLPSAEPKTPSNGSITSMNTEKMHVRTTDDLISRQAAIDLLKQMRKDGNMVPWEGKDVFARIRKLPPAQPEIIRCRECKFASGDSRICMKFGHSPIGELDFCAWAERRTDE